MKKTHKLIPRGEYWYSENIETGKRKSLHTKSRDEAEKLVSVKNEENNNPQFNREMGTAYFKLSDPLLCKRTWEDVLTVFSEVGPAESTKDRKRRAFRKGGRFDIIRNINLVDTIAEDFHKIIIFGQTSNIQYLKQLQRYALDCQWLLQEVIANRKIIIPKSKTIKRAVTTEEHRRIISAELNTERRAYYSMLWLTGAAQTDCANLCAENFDLVSSVLTYNRKKTKQDCRLSIGSQLKNLLEGLPQEGFLFPVIQDSPQNARATEFRRRCKTIGIEGISLHSYRYAFAERAYEANIPERFAMLALGHNSKAIHRAYAKGANVVCPALDDNRPTEILNATSDTILTSKPK